MEINPMERHYTTAEIAEKWSMSPLAVHRMFYDRPDVLKLGADTTRRRTRRELRIPESVMIAVYKKCLSR